MTVFLEPKIFKNQMKLRSVDTHAFRLNVVHAIEVAFMSQEPQVIQVLQQSKQRKCGEDVPSELAMIPHAVDWGPVRLVVDKVELRIDGLAA